MRICFFFVCFIAFRWTDPFTNQSVLLDLSPGFCFFKFWISLHSGAFAKVKESQRMSDEGKMDQDEADGIRKRCRTVGFALQAEMSHFHRQREVDFKDMMQAYLREQIAFYQRVVQQLERTLRMYDCL